MVVNRDGQSSVQALNGATSRNNECSGANGSHSNE